MMSDPLPPSPVPVALLGRDYPGLRPRAVVAEGEVVAPGQVLFHDVKRPEIEFVSPIRGRVASIGFGPRRTLSAIVIEPAKGGPASPANMLPEGGDLRPYLLSRGLWPAFVTRPYGGPPDPGARPDAIIVSAVPARGSALDPQAILSDRQSDFADGMNALTELTEGQVHLCLAAQSTIPIPANPRIKAHRKRFARDWHRPGGQVARLHPVGPLEQVWTIGYQDVVAIGSIRRTGIYDPIRTISLQPEGRARAQIMQAPLGADLRTLFAADGALSPELEPRSGPHGHSHPAAYLGRHHLDAALAAVSTSRRSTGPQPLIPLTGLDRALPAHVQAVPLMRALSIGDLEACARLGCLDLLEEDVVPLTALCASGTNYERCLRDVLDQLQKDAA